MANEEDESEIIEIDLTSNSSPRKRKANKQTSPVVATRSKTSNLQTSKRPRISSWAATRSNNTSQVQATKKPKTSPVGTTHSNTFKAQPAKRPLFSIRHRQDFEKRLIKSASKKPIPILLKKAPSVSPQKPTYVAPIQEAPTQTHRKKTPRKSALVATPDSRLIASAQKPKTRSTSKTVYGVSILKKRQSSNPKESNQFYFTSRFDNPSSGSTDRVPKTVIETNNKAQDHDGSDVAGTLNKDQVPPCSAASDVQVSDGHVIQSASTPVDQVTQSPSIPEGQVGQLTQKLLTQSDSTPVDQVTKSSSTPEGQVTQSAPKPLDQADQVTQSSSIPEGPVTQSASTPVSTVTNSSQPITTGYIVLDEHNRATQYLPADSVKLTPSENVIFVLKSSDTDNSSNKTPQLADTTSTATTASSHTSVHRPQDVERPSSASQNGVPVSADTAEKSVQGPTASFDTESGNLLIPDGAGGIATYRFLPTSSTETHQKALTHLCRICGHRCLKWQEAKTKTGLDKYRHAIRMLKTYKIDVMLDDPGIDPRYLCQSCASNLSVDKPSNKPVVTWTKHGLTGSECKACQTWIKTSKGGRPVKSATIGVQHRKEREAVERQQREKREAVQKQKRDVEAACDTLLCSQELVEKVLNTKDFANDYQMGMMNNKLQKATTMLVKCLLKGSEDGTIELPTGGPKLVLRKVVKPKVPSSKASAKTVRNRNKVLRQEILKICRPSEFELEEEECLRKHEGLLKKLNIPNTDIIAQEKSQERDETHVPGENAASISEGQVKKKKSKKRKPDKGESQINPIAKQKTPQKIVLSKTHHGWKQGQTSGISKVTHGHQQERAPQTKASQGIQQNCASSGEKNVNSGTISFPVTLEIPAGGSDLVQVPTTNVVTQEIPMEHSFVPSNRPGESASTAHVPTTNVVTQEIPTEHSFVHLDRPGERGLIQVPTTNVITQHVPHHEHPVGHVQSHGHGERNPIHAPTVNVVTQEIPHHEHPVVPSDGHGENNPIQVPTTNVITQEIQHRERPVAPFNQRPGANDPTQVHMPTTNITQETPQEHPMFYEEQVEIPGYGLVRVTHRFEQDK